LAGLRAVETLRPPFPGAAKHRADVRSVTRAPSKRLYFWLTKGGWTALLPSATDETGPRERPMLQQLFRPRWETMWTDLALVPVLAAIIAAVALL